MANVQDAKKRILQHFDSKGWEIPDVASALGISEQYLRRILNKPEEHLKQITDIISYYKIR
ncbi:helix-turn-helix domain-containing protein [Enterococcus diestrammenae]|uniref:helix-turn-helix domain-containing protein n=1 Tax=Enterococcus diestrammenae TaxID=1155073 RepID=UPI0022E82F01|nr:helix-turn-helix domain-containing protein [Enterococcus diestrammenae]